MQRLIHQVKNSSEFEMIWRIPFEIESSSAMSYVMRHLEDIIHGDCWAAGTSEETFFNLHDLQHVDEEYWRQLGIRDKILETPSPILGSREKVYIIMGGRPFRYATIEYTPKGLGILTDYQILQ